MTGRRLMLMRGGGASYTPDLWIVYGQSRALGRDAIPALSTVAVTGANAPQMFSTGVRAGTASGATLVPLVEATSGSDGETPAWGFARRLWQLTGRPLVVLVVAANAVELDTIDKPSATYTTCLDYVSRFFALTGGRVAGVLWLQGEQDQAFARTTYAARLATFLSDLDTDVKGITGQADDLVMVIDQFISGAPNASGVFAAGTSIAYQQYLAMLADPTHVTVGSAMFNYSAYRPSDGSSIHFAANGARQCGERLASAAYAKVYQGSAWNPVRPIPGQVNFSSGVGGAPTNTIVAKFYCPVPPLQFAFDYVGRLPSPLYGLAYFDDTSPPPVTAAAITAADEITITLAGVPTGSAPTRALRVAFGSQTGTLSGPFRNDIRCNLCDSETATGYDGTVLRNWAVIAHEPVT